MFNILPVIDSVETVDYILEKAVAANGVRVFPSGCITMGQQGEELTDMAALKSAGVYRFSEDGRSVDDVMKLREGMILAKSLDMPIFDHTEDRRLASGGSLNKGRISELTGIKGIPHEAEESIAIRDILLAKETGCKIHISHVSSAGTMDLIRLAKQWGVNVTAETAPHYLYFTDEDVLCGNCTEIEKYHIDTSTKGIMTDTHKKMNPPLRTEADRRAAIFALMDGTLDMIATDHAPHSAEEKSRNFESAPFGVTGLETSFAVCHTQLVVKHAYITPIHLISLMSTKPAELLGRGGGTLKIGERADVAVIDSEAVWTVMENEFESKAHNTAFAGEELQGKVKMTVAGGKIIYKYGEM